MARAGHNQGPALASERLGFTLFLSVCVHAPLILVLGVSALDRLTRPPVLEITLAQYRSEAAPEAADFLAQENQRGSGSLDEKAAPTTPVVAPFQAHDAPAAARRTAPASSPADAAALLSSANATPQAPAAAQSVDAPRPPAETDGLQSEDLDATIASLQAQLEQQRQAYAKRPRKYTISSASTRQDRDARYLDSWRKHIEAVGNQHYPAAASREGLYGTLRLLLALRPDGSVYEARVLSSSGHALLDEAALSIVRLAAPYEPFPPDLREDVDILEIVRTWQFHAGNSLSSY